MTTQDYIIFKMRIKSYFVKSYTAIKVSTLPILTLSLHYYLLINVIFEVYFQSWQIQRKQGMY